jgi:hypothetical protein
MKYKRKLKNFLLMPKIQLRYLYYVMAINVAPLAALLAYSALQIQKLRLQLATYETLPTGLLAEIEQTFTHLSIAYVLCFFSVLGLIAYGIIVVSHRFVGPIFVINRYITAMINGDYETERELRKDDEFKETFDLLKQLGRKLNHHDDKS